MEWEGKESNGGDRRNEMRGMTEKEKKEKDSEWVKGRQQ